MKKYNFIYRNNNEDGRIIFETDEDDILVADKQVEKIIGKLIVKCPHIGCEVKVNKQ